MLIQRTEIMPWTALLGSVAFSATVLYWLVCCCRQGFNKNLSPQSVCTFRAFGNYFMSYMVL